MAITVFHRSQKSRLRGLFLKELVGRKTLSHAGGAELSTVF